MRHLFSAADERGKFQRRNDSTCERFLIASNRDVKISGSFRLDNCGSQRSEAEKNRPNEPHVFSREHGRKNFRRVSPRQSATTETESIRAWSPIQVLTRLHAADQELLCLNQEYGRAMSTYIWNRQENCTSLKLGLKFFFF